MRVTAEIPEARFVALEGREISPTLGDVDSVLRTMWGFLGEEDQGAAPPALPSGTAIILFADIVDSTALTERMGDATFRAKARDLDAALRTVIREHAGMPIEGKLLGDGVLAVFTSARQAIEAALVCARAGDDAGLPLHLGLHAGDVIREDNNVYGGAVNVASRISGHSRGWGSPCACGRCARRRDGTRTTRRRCDCPLYGYRRLGCPQDQPGRRRCSERDHFDLLREPVKSHGGQEVKTLGDGLMAVQMWTA